MRQTLCYRGLVHLNTLKFLWMFKLSVKTRKTVENVLDINGRNLYC